MTLSKSKGFSLLNNAIAHSSHRRTFSRWCPFCIEKIDKFQVCVMSFFVTEHGEEQFKTTLYIRPQRWSIFQGDGMVNVFFLGHHCRQWFFNGFDKVGPSPLNVFLGVQPLEPMVFRWFSKF